MSKFRAWLCRNRIEVRNMSTIYIIVFPIVTGLEILKKGSEYFDTAGIVFISLFTLVIIVSFIFRAMIRFSEWQFRTTFNCDPPRRKQDYARARLSTLVQDTLTHLTAQFDAAVQLHTKMKADAELEAIRKTSAGAGRAEQYNDMAASIWFEWEKTRGRFRCARTLARAFGFDAPELEEYLTIIHASEQTQAILKPAGAESSH